MPYQSKKQMHYLRREKPEVAKKFEAHSGGGKMTGRRGPYGKSKMGTSTRRCR